MLANLYGFVAGPRLPARVSWEMSRRLAMLQDELRDEIGTVIEGELPAGYLGLLKDLFVGRGWIYVDKVSWEGPTKRTVSEIRAR